VVVPGEQGRPLVLLHSMSPDMAHLGSATLAVRCLISDANRNSGCPTLRGPSEQIGLAIRLRRRLDGSEPTAGGLSAVLWKFDSSAIGIDAHNERQWPTAQTQEFLYRSFQMRNLMIAESKLAGRDTTERTQRVTRRGGSQVPLISVGLKRMVSLL
jgi:hypothetical protein